MKLVTTDVVKTLSGYSNADARNDRLRALRAVATIPYKEVMMNE